VSARARTHTHTEHVVVIFKRLRCPRIVSELLSGIILGPSVLGYASGFSDLMFTSPNPYNILVGKKMSRRCAIRFNCVGKTQVVSYYGMGIFMFCVGLEQDMGLFAKALPRTSLVTLAILVESIIFGLPFAYLTDSPQYHSVNFYEHVMFVGLLLSTVALPTLARLVIEFEFSHTPLGVFALQAAAVDTFAWPISKKMR
jgi:Kef-type K+ transport system membrane component KefB